MSYVRVCAMLHVDPGARIGNTFRRLSCVVIKSGRERKLTERRCQGTTRNEGDQLHAVKISQWLKTLFNSVLSRLDFRSINQEETRH